MTEQLRQHYLQALGIESYLPRWVLPGAADSHVYEEPPGCEVPPACELPAEEAEQVEAESSSVAAVASNMADLSAREGKPALASNLFGETKKVRASQRPAPTALPRATSQHRFTLSAWRIGLDVMVLDSRQLQLALPVEQLLLNMSRALGIGRSGLSEGELLRWPLLENSSHDFAQSIEHARGMVHAYLAAQHEKQPIGTVLLMGGDAARHTLSAADFDSGEAGGKPGISRLLGKTFSLPCSEAPPHLEGGATTSGSALQAIVLPSLAALLQKPSLKMLVWQAIKPLCVSA